MLSSNYLLKNGRYSIERTIRSGPAGTLYFASDLMRKTRVAIIEMCDPVANDELDGRSLARIQHEGLVRISDDFEERSCRYSATESLAISETEPPTDAAGCESMFERLRAILTSLSAMRDGSGSAFGVEISRDSVLRTGEGKLKLLYPGSDGFTGSVSGPTDSFAPLEGVWEQLDHITQKAIYNSYDDASLAVLESAADDRTRLYSLGAVFYRLLTGQDPLPAVVRSIEMLDSNADSLKTPASLNPVVNTEQSDFILRMLEVRREMRFASIEDAIFSLPSAPLSIEPAPQPVVPEPEDFPLLELPTTPVAQIPRPAVPAPTMTAAPVQKTADVDTSGAFRPPFVAKEQVIEPPSAPKPVSIIAAEQRPELKREFGTEKKQDIVPFEQAEAASSSQMKFIAVGAGALVVAISIGWFALGGSSAKQADPAAAMTAPQAVVQEQPQTLSQEAPSSTTEPVNSMDDTPDNTDTSSPLKPRPQIAETRVAPQKTPKPAAKTEAKPTKKLTVDDLIN